MAVSGNVFYIDDNNREDYETLCKQLAGLIHSASSDFENIVASSLINPWAKNKPFRYNDPNFGYDYNNPAPAETARAAARKEKNQGLLLPTQKNVGVSAQIPQYKWLNYLAYIISNGGIESYPYLRPRGASVSPKEYNRIRDFDGYNHNAGQPFKTSVVLIKADGTQEPVVGGVGDEIIDLNRFAVKTVRFILVTQPDADMSVADIAGTNAAQFYFSAELYERVNNAQTNVWYNLQAPTTLLKATSNITSIPQNNGSVALDYTLKEENDNWEIVGICGINQYETNSNVPMSLGNGFVAPWTAGQPYPFLFPFRQTFHAEMLGKVSAGYYYNGGWKSFVPTSAANTPNKTTTSDSIGIAITVPRMAADLYFVGTRNYSLPAGAFAYSVRATIIGPTSKVVQCTIVDSDMTTEIANGLGEIDMTGAAEQTVYLKFNGALSNMRGIKLSSLLLELGRRNDDGTISWPTMTDFWASVPFNITYN